MRIVITGGDGFIASNLRVRLRETGYDDVVGVTRGATAESLASALAGVDFVFHLAGVNRPKDAAEFESGNVGFTETLCAALEDTGRRVPIAFASSTQATLDNPYGRSKRLAESVLERYGRATGAAVYVYRLANVFGKWSRPNYNSVVATFCHNLTRGLPITVHDPNTRLNLLYVDDVVSALIGLLEGRITPGFLEVGPIYSTSLGELVSTLEGFVTSRHTLLLPPVGQGLTRGLHATYLSFLPPSDFAYDLERHSDPRGVFIEMLKTRDTGQVSYFTALPGVTRGEHYHHSKTEKFLVVAGTARFGFRHILTNEVHELVVEGGRGRIVETVPGWTHNVTNIGADEMIVLLWANEVFDPKRPDTVASKVRS